MSIFLFNFTVSTGSKMIVENLLFVANIILTEIFYRICMQTNELILYSKYRLK